MSLDIGGIDEFASEDDAGAPPDSLSIGGLLSNATPVHWDEGVAVVQELIDALTSSGKELPVPHLDDVCIHSDGTVAILRPGRGDRGPAAAARVLHELLSGNDVPVALRLFVSQATAPETYASLREFAAGLAYYGKPGRADLIQAVYHRYAARPARPAVASAHAAAPEPIRKDEPPQRKSPAWVSWRPPFWIAPVVLTLIALGAGIWVLSKVEFGRSAPDARKGAATAEAQPPSTKAAGPTRAEKNGESSGRPASIDRRAATTAKEAPTVTNVARPSSPAIPSRLAFVPSPSPSVDAAVADADEPLPSSVVPMLPSRTRPVRSEPDRIYSGDDSDVQPPTMRYPQLPAPILISASGSELVNRMEILVATDGSVERVRLVGNPARMPDMMLLSGAKLWRFSPALKDGEPVRYRTFVTWSGFP